MTLNRDANTDQTDGDGELEPPEVRRFSMRILLAFVATALIAGPFLVLLLLVLGKWHGLSSVDSAVVDWAHRLAVDHHPLTRSMIVVSTVLHPLVLRLVASGVSLGCLAYGRWRVGIWGLAAAWGSGLIDTLAKSGVARVRPHLPDPVATAPGYSFPSGHALGSLVCLGVIVVGMAPVLPRPVRRYLWPVWGVLVGLVGFARVELGVHYPSDVIAGWLLGAAWLAASAAAFDVLQPALSKAQDAGRGPGDPAVSPP
jgi:undecaprenyl-diphosphatase